MKDVSLEEFVHSLEEHNKLLKILGYHLDVIPNTVPLHEEIKIYKDDKIVGTLTHKDKNMYWLKEKKEVLANENISAMRFSQIPKYNKKPVFHLVVNDGKFRMNCYNIFNKNYIAFENKKIKIKKFADFIKIEVRNEEEKIKYTVFYPDRTDSNEDYNQEINKIFGHDVIGDIESYYNKAKVRTKKGV